MAEAQATGWQTADAVPYACMGKYLACVRLVLGFGADPVVEAIGIQPHVADNAIHKADFGNDQLLCARHVYNSQKNIERRHNDVCPVGVEAVLFHAFLKLEAQQVFVQGAQFGCAHGLAIAFFKQL